MNRLLNAIRWHIWFQENPPREPLPYIPQIYVPTHRKAPQANKTIETALTKFTNQINKQALSLPTSKQFNLRKGKRQTLYSLSQRHDILFLNTDKNQGPASVERIPYIKSLLANHFNTTKNYKFIPQQKHQEILLQRDFKFLKLYKRYHLLLPRVEQVYFDRSLAPEKIQKLKIGCAYGLPKVHKPMDKKFNLPPFRLVVALNNTIDSIFSNYVDYKLKPIMKNHVPTYIPDSDALRDSLQNTFPYGTPPTDSLFSLDAVGMYPNIDIKQSIEFIEQWLTVEASNTVDKKSVKFLLQALELCMTENIFYFGDLLIQQLSGTAIGTKCAVVLANLYAGLPEKRTILIKYAQHLPFLKRFIDDIIGVWRTHPTSPYTFKDFQTEMNKTTSLKWTVEGLTNKLNFLDLTITIDPATRKLIFETYQKTTSLYNYIPPHSAHPPGVLKSMIFGRLR